MDTVDGGYKKPLLWEKFEKYSQGYTDEVIDVVLGEVKKINVNREESNVMYDILELGAGSGLFTRRLRERSKDVRILAGEPLDSFLEEFNMYCPRVEVVKCVAADIPLPDNSVKVVVCVRCFHWFADERSLSEINRVLVPGGQLVIVWNENDRSVPWIKQMMETVHVYAEEQGGPPAIAFDMRWSKVFQCIDFMELSGDVQMPGVRFGGSKEFVLNYLCTLSCISGISDKVKQEEALSLLSEIIDSGQDKDSYIHIPCFVRIRTYKNLKPMMC